MSHWNAQQIPDQTGKIALVTGANSGIGFHTALELARAGATTILGCRNIDKAEIAMKEIKNQVPNAKIEIANLDIGDLSSISRYAKEFIDSKRSLDILINNAGIMTPPKRLVTKDGFEIQWGTNHLGHFALTGKLLPVITKAESGRIVTVSSIAHRGAKINFEDLNSEKSYKPMSVYGQSKLANIVFGIELQKRLINNKSKVLSMVAHPGVVASNLTNNSYDTNPTLMGWISKTFVHYFASPALNGALPSLYAATAKEAEGGKLYGPNAFFGLSGYPVEEKPNKAATSDATLPERLWDISEKLTGVSFL